MEYYVAQSSNNKESKIYAFLIILAISIALPYSLHLFLRAQDKADEAIVQTTMDNTTTEIITNIVYITNTVYVVPPKTNINWLSSPITQNWQWDGERSAWHPTPSLKDSYRYSPSIEIGLKEDGTVVWRSKK